MRLFMFVRFARWIGLAVAFCALFVFAALHSSPVTAQPAASDTPDMVATFVAGTLSALPTFTPSPSPTIDQLGTAIVRTVEAALTQTASARPSHTPTPTETATFTPSATRTPTMTRTPMPTATITLTPSATRTPSRTQPPTRTRVPTRTLSPTPDRADALDAEIREIDPTARRIFGPQSGSLRHNPDDSRITLETLSVEVSDFILDITFTNPYASATGAWDYGIVFRVTPDQDYIVLVTSRRQWALYRREGDDSRRLSGGNVSGLNVRAGGTNTLRLVVRGRTSQLFINGRRISNRLNTAAHLEAGRIFLATGIFRGAERADAETRYDNLIIWEIGEARPTPSRRVTPTPTVARRGT